MQFTAHDALAAHGDRRRPALGRVLPLGLDRQGVVAEDVQPPFRERSRDPRKFPQRPPDAHVLARRGDAQRALPRQPLRRRAQSPLPPGFSPIELGDQLRNGQGSDIRPGNALPLRYIPVGTVVHNVELKPGAGGKLGRGAGVAIQLVAKEGQFATLRLPSTEMRRVPIDCRATVGEVGNSEHELIKIGKAGRNRWKGVRPQTRGVAMNPVDHPHGGGEGKTSGGRHPVSPWGKPEGRTRDKTKPSQQLIVRRRRTRGSRR